MKFDCQKLTKINMNYKSRKRCLKLLLLIFSFSLSLTNCELSSSLIKSKHDHHFITISPINSNTHIEDEDEEYRRIDAIYHKSLDEHLPKYPHSHEHIDTRTVVDESIKRTTKKKRSHKHLQICRREFLKPIEGRLQEADVVFTGIIERIKRNPSLKLSSGWYRANVRVKQIIKDNSKYQTRSEVSSKVISENMKVIVEGFGSKKICDSDAKVKDSRIFFVTFSANGRLKLNSSLIRINLDNLRKTLTAEKLNQQSYLLTTPTSTTVAPRYDTLWTPTTPAVFYLKPISSLTRSDWPSSWSRPSTTVTPSASTTEVVTEAETATETELMQDSRHSGASNVSKDVSTPKDVHDEENILLKTPSRTMRRRSNAHLAICRREFLRPLEDRILSSDLVFTGIVERIHKRQTYPYQRSRRHHDPFNNYDKETSNLRGQRSSGHESKHKDANWYRGIVRVKRIIKGNKEYEGQRLMIEGFGSRKICDADIKSSESRIFLVNSTKNHRFKITSSLMRIDFDNLKKVISASRSKL